MTNKTYIAAEPEKVEAYMDTRQMMHTSRDAAIAANFDYDLQRIISKYSTINNLSLNPVEVRYAIEHLADEHADMLRIILGDRDAT